MNFLAVFKKSLSVFIFIASAFVAFSNDSQAQDRERVIKKDKKQTKKQKTETRSTTVVPSSQNSQRPTLTNEIKVRKKETPQELVRRTSKSQIRKTNKSAPLVKRNGAIVRKRVRNRAAYSAITQSMMYNSIRRKIGIRYRLGTQGPRAYDCSGFVWKVFQESGIPFTRTSARQYWRTFPRVYGEDRFEFGTLVFFNRLGHVGIVVDRNGFYHASTSRGVVYSKFNNYWKKRIVGFRRVPGTSWNDAIEIEQLKNEDLENQ